MNSKKRRPGPGHYALPPTIGYVNHDRAKHSSPAYTFHRRMSSNMVSVDCSPGPQYHIDAKMTRFGRVDCRSLQPRESSSQTFLLHYWLSVTLPYTHPNLLGSQVPHKPSSASYSLAGRRQVGAPSEDRSMTSGPGRYNSTDPSVYLTQPSFSMQSRTTRASDQSQKPGPGTHSPEKVLLHLPRPPAFSLGIRHSEFITPLVVVVSD
ncbi:outer dense fiber protein 3-like protein 2 [Oncorhynchus mykiss]|uniref:outer dense fiber protein 3-like protein 2 n=1 Tax=Oncorhynchus mykiss TaxID=8022 RepID=UPI001877DDD1|nr:outer dense fiber protein 3-like protein 2 [Oncorhynchus mykiss]